MNNPLGVTVDANGNVYAANTESAILTTNTQNTAGTQQKRIVSGAETAK